MTRETLLDFFDTLASQPGSYLTYDNGFRSWTHTYREVGAASRRFAARLGDGGFGKGDKVIIWSENRPEWIVALFGCLLRGVVLVPVDYRASPDFLSRVRAAVHSRLVLVGDEVAWDLPGDVWKLSGIDWTGAPGDRAAVSRDDLAQIIFTSGATSEPKGVTITHRNLLANIVPVEREILKHRRWGRVFFPIRFLNLLPLSHLFGQAMAAFIPPMLPGEVVFMHGYNPKDIVSQVRRRRISVLVSVPKILAMLREYVIQLIPEAKTAAPEGERWWRRWWRYRRVHNLLGWKLWSFVVGAAPLDVELERFWSRLGFVVIQGYGLTETAPIVTLNHPFHARGGTVGKPIAGVEVRIADDGEVLVRGENVTQGYFNAAEATEAAFGEGWFHTGDIGSMDEEGRLRISGRKKEMIVTPEGLNVFPEDVERVLLSMPGVRDAAAVGSDRVHAVLLLDEGRDAGEIVRLANARLENHQQIRGVSIWPDRGFPRTEGTGKLKRGEIARWVASGAEPASSRRPDRFRELVARYAPGREIGPGTSVAELGLSSLERMELMTAFERGGEGQMDESAFAAARTVAELELLAAQPRAISQPPDFPEWNQSWWARAHRRVHLPLWILPLARVFAWVRAEGREHLAGLSGPVLFAATHQSHFDVPAILMALPPRWRHNTAPAMSKEFFHAHFFPRERSRREWFTNSLNYYLASLFFNAFPLPQREAGAREAMVYMGSLASRGVSILIFPEGRFSQDGSIAPFRPGVGMLASRLQLPVVPIKLQGLDRVLPRGARWPTPGRVRVKFGPPLRLAGDDYAAIAGEIERAVRVL